MRDSTPNTSDCDQLAEAIVNVELQVLLAFRSDNVFSTPPCEEELDLERQLMDFDLEVAHHLSVDLVMRPSQTRNRHYSRHAGRQSKHARKIVLHETLYLHRETSPDQMLHVSKIF